MKISTWNVNSIRARIDNIKKYLKSSSPDIVLLQEIKTEEQNYPFNDLKELEIFDPKPNYYYLLELNNLYLSVLSKT